MTPLDLSPVEAIGRSWATCRAYYDGQAVVSRYKRFIDVRDCAGTWGFSLTVDAERLALRYFTPWGEPSRFDFNDPAMLDRLDGEVLAHYCALCVGRPG